MFIQIITTIFYVWGKNQIQFISLGVIKITSFITLLFQIGMGLTLMITSFNIVSQSRSIMDYN